MKRTNVTYGQLHKILKSLGFSCEIDRSDPPTRIYRHEPTGAVIFLPEFAFEDLAFDYHLAGVRITLDNFGVAAPSVFEAKLQKAG